MYELLLSRIFDQIGFNQIGPDLFKPLVLSRLESKARIIGSDQTIGETIITNEEQKYLADLFNLN